MEEKKKIKDAQAKREKEADEAAVKAAVAASEQKIRADLEAKK